MTHIAILAISPRTNEHTTHVTTKTPEIQINKMLNNSAYYKSEFDLMRNRHVGAGGHEGEIAFYLLSTGDENTVRKVAKEVKLALTAGNFGRAARFMTHHLNNPNAPRVVDIAEVNKAAAVEKAEAEKKAKEAAKIAQVMKVVKAKTTPKARTKKPTHGAFDIVLKNGKVVQNSSRTEMLEAIVLMSQAGLY